MRAIVLKITDNEKGDGFFPHLDFQIATVQEYSSLEDAACTNVGNHPDARKRNKPYRVVVIPEEHFHQFDVWSELEQGKSFFKAYPVDDEDKVIK